MALPFFVSIHLFASKSSSNINSFLPSIVLYATFSQEGNICETNFYAQAISLDSLKIILNRDLTLQPPCVSNQIASTNFEAMNES